ELEDVLQPEGLPAVGQEAHAEVGQLGARRERAGVDRADAGAAEDLRDCGGATAGRELAERVAQHARLVRAARAASGEDERERLVPALRHVRATGSAAGPRRGRTSAG